MTEAETLAVEAIRRLNADYADAVIRRDAVDWGALWSETARWDFLGECIEGRAAIVERWLAAMAGFPVVWHQLCSEQLTLSGDALASGRVYLAEDIVTTDGQSLRFLGVYEDAYVREGERWLYGHRAFHLIYQGPGALAGDGWQGFGATADTP